MGKQSNLNFHCVWADYLDEVLCRGQDFVSDKGQSKELIGRSFTLHDTTDVFLRNNRRDLSAVYAWAEILWYWSRSSDIEMLKAYAPQYVKFTSDGKTADGSYGYRVATNAFDFDQLVGIVDLLKQKPDTRQAVVTLWCAFPDLPRALKGVSRDLPCTLTWQFLARAGKLHMIVNMRSNDLWLGMPYDVFAFTRIQRALAHTIGLLPGSYTHNVGSLHLYEKNYAAAAEAKSEDYTEVNYDAMHDLISDFNAFTHAVAQEQRIRLGEPMLDLHILGWERRFNMFKEYWNDRT